MIVGLVVGVVVAESLIKCSFFLLEDQLPKGPTTYLQKLFLRESLYVTY